MGYYKALFIVGLSLAAASILKGSETEDLAATLSQDRDVRMLTVFCLSSEVETRAALAPDDARKMFSYQYVCKDVPFRVTNFLKNVHGHDFKSSAGHDVDCRWTFIVSDASGHERLVLHADGFLEKGFANGTSFKLDTSFREWINKTFSEVFDPAYVPERDKP